MGVRDIFLRAASAWSAASAAGARACRRDSRWGYKTRDTVTLDTGISPHAACLPVVCTARQLGQRCRRLGLSNAEVRSGYF